MDFTRPKRCPRQPTGREDRHSNFYEIPDNLVDVIQADINRCGGLTEIRRIADLAAVHGALCIPHCWKTGVTAAASRHYQAATVNAPIVEMFHPALFPSRLRAELTGPEPEIVDGRIALPDGPGLGVELDPEAVERYLVT